MKTKDFMSALGGINERYLRDMLEAPAANGTEKQKPVIVPGLSAGSEQQPHPVSVQKTDSGHAGSGIMRYLVLAASAAACIGGVSLLALLGRQTPEDATSDSESVEITEIQAEVTSADSAAETTGSVTTETTGISSRETTASSDEMTGQRTEQTAAETGQSAAQEQTAAGTTGSTSTSVRVTTSTAKTAAKKTPENNVKIVLYNWMTETDEGASGANGIAAVWIRTKDGKIVYDDTKQTHFTLPDGEYSVSIKLWDGTIGYIDPDSDFAAQIRKLHPSVTFSGQRGSIDFAVIDGKPDRELRFDFGPIDGTVRSVTICCVDAVGLKPIPGVEMKLAEVTDTDAKVIGRGETDTDGTCTFSGLVRTGTEENPPYVICFDCIPEGYYCVMKSSVILREYSAPRSTFAYVFTPNDLQMNASAVIYDAYEEGKVLGDIATYELWRTDYDGGTALVHDSIQPGEKIALADGSYRAILHYEEAENSGYQLADAYRPADWWSTHIIDFYVRYGKPDREIAFYLEDVDHAERRSLGLTDD